VAPDVRYPPGEALIKRCRFIKAPMGFFAPDRADVGIASAGAARTAENRARARAPLSVAAGEYVIQNLIVPCSEST
jgi:hypothetical protein